jgi:RHS repeat-associated protein
LGRIRKSATIRVGPSTPLHVTIDAPSCNGKTIRFGLQVTYAGGATPTPSPDEVIYLGRDRLDSTILVTSFYGDPEQYYRYGPYGETEAFDDQGEPVAAGGELTELLYTGQRRDADSGLYYYNARFYDPAIARFLTHDLARELINPYAYVGWTPTNANDPTGAFIDYVIDAAFLAASIYTTAGAWQAGNATFLDKVLDVGALTIDVAATALPVVPAFAGRIRSGIYIARAGRAAELGKTANRADTLLHASNGPQTVANEAVAGALDAAEKGGLSLYKYNDATSLTTQGWKDGDRFLWGADQGTPNANWLQNASQLRSEMRAGNPIFDSYRNLETGELLQSRGFLGAERNLLMNQGWGYSAATGAWHAPLR